MSNFGHLRFSCKSVFHWEINWLYPISRTIFTNMLISLVWHGRFTVYLLITLTTRPTHVLWPCRVRFINSRYILDRKSFASNMLDRDHSFIILSWYLMWSGKRPVSPRTAAVGVLWLTPRMVFSYFNWTCSNYSIGISWHQISLTYSRIGLIWVSKTFR